MPKFTKNSIVGNDRQLLERALHDVADLERRLSLLERRVGKLKDRIEREDSE